MVLLRATSDSFTGEKQRLYPERLRLRTVARRKDSYIPAALYAKEQGKKKKKKKKEHALRRTAVCLFRFPKKKKRFACTCFAKARGDVADGVLPLQKENYSLFRSKQRAGRLLVD